jgi:hypothetical protein
MEKSRGPDDQVDQVSQALDRLHAVGSPPKYSRQWRGRRPATAVGWRDRVEWDPPWQAAPQMGDRASAASLRRNLDLGPRSRRGHGGFARRRQRNAGARLQGEGSRPAGEPHRPRGVVSLVAELRGRERQAAEESERWIAHHEERKPLDASPTAIRLAPLLTGEELDSLENSAGDGEIAGADDQVDQMSQAPNRLRSMVSLPEYPPPMPRPPTGAVGWRELLESEPPWQAVRSAAHGPIPLMGISHQESAAGVNPRFGRDTSKSLRLHLRCSLPGAEVKVCPLMRYTRKTPVRQVGDRKGRHFDAASKSTNPESPGK